MSKALLAVDKLVVRYGGIEALTDVSLRVEKGEIVALIGANGAGKSSLLMSICGQPTAAAGSIHFAAQNITARRTADIIGLGIALVPEGRRIFPALTVEENLRLGGFSLSAARCSARLAEMCDLFPRLGERRRQLGGTLSGGEQQMLAIARALMSGPRLLLLDEPSLGLAPRIVAAIFALLETIRQQDVTVFLVEQNARLALQSADRAYVLETGRIRLAGIAADLLQEEAIIHAYLGQQEPT